MYMKIFYSILAAAVLSTCAAPQGETIVASLDSDFDGVENSQDNCLLRYNPDQLDGDQDNVGDLCDNCPRHANGSQIDGDRDNWGDACDACAADRRYALESEAELCASTSNDTYRFALRRTQTIDSTAYPELAEYVRRKRANNSKFGASVVYLGDKLIDGSTGAVLGIGERKPKSPGGELIVLHFRDDLTLVQSPVIRDCPVTDTVSQTACLSEMNNNFAAGAVNLGVLENSSTATRLVGLLAYHNRLNVVRLDADTTWTFAEAGINPVLAYDQYSSTDGIDWTAGERPAVVALGDIDGDASSYFAAALTDTPELNDAHAGEIHVAKFSGQLTSKLSINIEKYVPFTSADNSDIVENYAIGYGITTLPELHTGDTGTLIAFSAVARSGKAGLGKIYIKEIGADGRPVTPNAPAEEIFDASAINVALGDGTVTNRDRFGYSLHNLGDLDGPGQGYATFIAVGAPFSDIGGFSIDLRDNRGGVFILGVDNDRNVDYVAAITDQTPNGPALLRKGLFGYNLSSFTIAGRVYLAVAAPGNATRFDITGRVYLIELE